MTPETFLFLKGSAKAQGGCGPSLVLPSRSYFALGRGAPLFGCAPSLWLFVCCCRARALLGCSGGAGVPPSCCCLVRGVVLGFRKRADRWPLVGSRFVTVSKHKQSFSLNRLFTEVLAKNWTLVSRLRYTPPIHQADNLLGVVTERSVYRSTEIRRDTVPVS